MKLLSTFVMLLVVIPSALNKAIPQEDAVKTSSTEKDIDIETTTVIPDLSGGDSGDASSSSSTDDASSGSSSTTTTEDPLSVFGSSSTEETFSSTRKAPKPRPPYLPHHFSDDYDMFLDHVNRTSQFKLELFDRTLMEVEKELRPGTPLMKVVDYILNLFTQLQNNNRRRPKPSNGQAR